MTLFIYRGLGGNGRGSDKAGTEGVGIWCGEGEEISATKVCLRAFSF